MSNHDSHYRNIEENGLIEPIVRMESTICLGLPVEYHAIARRNLNLAMADKHIGRVGQKAGEVEDKELEKAGNYLHRARTGSWRPVAEDLPLFATPEKSCLGCRYRWTTEDHKPFCTFPGLLCVDFDRYDAGESPKKALTAANRKPLVSGDRGPIVTVTTHGKQSEATEAEVGKAMAELQAVPTQYTYNPCETCKHYYGTEQCAVCDSNKHDNWEPKPEEARVVPRGCASCEDGPSPSHCKLFHERRCGDIGSSFPLWKAKA